MKQLGKGGEQVSKGKNCLYGRNCPGAYSAHLWTGVSIRYFGVEFFW